MYIPFGEWLPDRPEYTREGALTARNVIPFQNGYLPMKDAGVYSSNGLDGDCSGAVSFIRPDGSIYTFAGDSGKLYRLNGTTFVNISKPGNYNSNDNPWRFVQWGDYVFATNYNDPIQKFRMGVDSNFSDLSSTAPRCKDMAVVNESLVLANTVDTIDGARQNRIWWSPIGDPFGTWTAGDPTTLCDFQDLVDGNFCVGVAGGDYGTVLMRNAIIRMTFVGPPLVFQIDTVEPVRGCVNIDSFVTDGRIVYFLSPEGFFAFNGASSQPIGATKVDKTFYDTLQDVYEPKVQAGLDPVNKVVVWAYVDNSTTNGYPNRWFMYNWVTNWWSEALFDPDEGDVTTVRFSQLYTQGYDLDTDFNVPDQDLDDTTTPDFDSSFWKGGVPVFGVFSTDNKLYYFNGDNREAYLEPAEQQFSPERRSFVNEVRAIVEGGSRHTLSYSARQTLQDTGSYNSVGESNSIGRFSIRSSGRYHKLKLTLKNDWTHARGLEVKFRPAGQR